MTSSATEFLSHIENQYFIWSRSEEKNKEITYQIEDVGVKIIFNQGRLIYPLANCPTPQGIEDSINITSNNNDKIRKLFENYLLEADAYKNHLLKEKCFSFPNYKNHKFEIRFFLNESLIKNKLLDEEKAYAPYESPRWELRPACILS